MPRSKKVRTSLSLIMTLLMLLGSFTSLAYADDTQFSSAKQDLVKEASMKIAPEVMKDLEKEDLVEVLVYMKDQVDTEMVARATRSAVSDSMTPYNTKMAVRIGVLEALRDKAESTQVRLINYLEQEKDRSNVVEFKSYHIVNMVYVKATKEVVENISYMPEVEKIYKNKTHTIDFPEMENVDIEPQGTEPQWNITRVGADQAWNLGYDGTGAVVGSLDSGVDWTHPALKEHWRGYDPNTGATDPSKNWFDPVYGATLPADSDSHGTHVMGTMVGVEPDGNNPVGVAPGAKWITARVFNTAGSTTDQILLDAAEWMLHPGGDPTAAPDVVNNSWGGGAGIDDWYLDAVRAWSSAQIFPVFSAGNQRDGEPLPWPGSISCPANYIESFAVAAVDRYDARASFSKLGPSPYDETDVKPNISGPGVSIYSSIPGGYTGGYSGTSMSAPHVSGTVALIAGANQALTVEDIWEVLEETADPLTDSTYPEAPNFGYGYGMVNAFEAVSSVASGTGYITGRVLVEGNDNELPVINHEQTVTEAYMGSDIDVVAEISDDVSITEVELLVKAEGASYWMLAPMNRISGDHKDGVYQGTITADMISGDSIVYKIKARDFVGDAVVTEDYRIDISFGVVPDEYTQGFENNALGWIMDGAWDWGIPSGTDPLPFEGEGLAGTVLGGTYPVSADDWMITAPIDLRDVSLPTATLRFNHWYNMENNYDKGYVYVTDDYGANWYQVGPTYTNTSNGWQEVVVNLDSYIGSPNPVFVGFRFTSDGSVVREGWYIDNVKLMGPDIEAPAIPTNLTAEAGMTGIRLTWVPSPDGDVSHYNIFRSEVSGGEYVEIAETSANSYVDNDVVANTTYYYVVNAEDTSGNISEYTAEVSATATEVVTLFSTDFENDNGGFITGGDSNPWEWGTPTSGPGAAASGVNLWATNLDGDYGTYAEAYIESPAITIPEDKVPVLTFNHWYNTENSYDYGIVQVSNDDGATWTDVTSKITNVSNGWINQEIQLGSYRGDTIKIRFNFHSDVSVVRAGWYVDDVSVVAINYVPVEQEVITYDDGVGEDALVLNEAGNGCAVRFTPAELGKLMGTDVYLWDNSWPTPGGNRLGFAIYQTNTDGTLSQVGETLYVDNLTRGAFNHVDLSGYNFFTEEDFYISTMQDDVGTNHPGTGMDTTSQHGARSYLNIAGTMEPLADEGFDGAFMIRAHMDYTQTPPEDELANVETRLVEVNNVEIGENATSLNSKDMVKDSEPSYSLKRIELNSYETISDAEVQNTPMIMGGVPVADAIVTILETGRSVKVDPATGKFNMRVPMGDYTLRAEAYGYYPEEAAVTVVEDGTATARFFLEPMPRGDIQGRVVDRYYGDPASYAVIRVVEDPKVAPVTADADGYFTISDVLVGDYTLKVVADGFDPGEFPVTVNADEVTNVELGLKRFVGYEDEIIYDDGTGENALVLNNAPNGLAVRFTPEQFGKVTGANVYFWDTSWPTPGGNRLGFTIYSTDENGTPSKVGEPIFIDNLVRGDWNYIDLSSFGFSTDRDFYISTIQDQPGTNCPGLGIDEDSPYGDRSYMNLDGEFQLISAEDIVGGLMIRAIVENSVSTPVITNLGEITYTNQDVITVEGTVGADCKVNVYVNGEIAAFADSENLGFAIEVNLPLDENVIMVTSELDGVQTEPSPEVRVIKDKVTPVLVVNEPLDNAKINVEVVHVIGNVIDDIELASLTINEQVIEIDEAGNFDYRLMVDAGENIITVKAMDGAGNETIITRTVIVELEAPVITNIEPSSDIELRAGETLTISFNAPTGGEGYFRILLPFGLLDTEIGIPMEEVEEGFYEETWTVPSGYVGTDLQVQVVYVSESGFEVTKIAEGRLTLIGDMEDLAVNTVIIDDEAFDMDFLNNDPDAQIMLIEWLDSGNQIFVKLDKDTIVDGNGELITIEELPDRLTYFDMEGSVLYFEK